MPLYPKQYEAIQACSEPDGLRKYVLLSGCRWSGKCVSPDTLVYTSAGLTPIGKMGKAPENAFSPTHHRVLALSKDGLDVSMATATQFYNSGFREANCVKTEMGYEIVCSPHHPIWSEHLGKIQFRTSDEIKALLAAGQQVWLPMMRQHPGTWPDKYQYVTFDWADGNTASAVEASARISAAFAAGARTKRELAHAAKSAGITVAKWMKSPTPERRMTIEIDEDFAYAIGVMVGDGCYTKAVMQGHMTIFSSSDTEIIAEMTRIMESRFPEASVVARSRYDYVIRSCAFRKFLHHTGMAHKYAHEKTIPDFIFGSPKSVVIAFIQGLFDTDGTVGKKANVSYCSASPVLAKQVHDVLLALGVRSTRFFKHNKCRGAWHIATREEDDFRSKVGFRLKRKQERANNRKLPWKVAWSAYPPSFVDVLKRLHYSRNRRGIGKLSRKVHKQIISNVIRRHISLSMKRIAPLAKVINCETEPSFQSYWMQGKVWWDQVKTCSPTESELVDLCVPETESFIAGGFINHNTYAGLFAICDHAWNTDGGSVCVLCTSIPAGSSSGIWTLLTENVIPQWIEANFGFNWAPVDAGRWKNKLCKPRQDGATKKLYCCVTNRFGGRTRIELNSLKDERDVEKEFKNRYFSMIYWSEMSAFNDRRTFDTLLHALRMPNVPEERHLLLCDTNPSDLGTEYFGWKIFYHTRTANPDDLDEAERPIQKHLKLVEFTLDDNFSLSVERKKEILSLFAHDPDLLARYGYGRWVKASSNALFISVFKPAIHVFGDVGELDPEMLLPEPNCSELITGWDPGGANPAMVIAEKVFRPVQRLPTGGGKLEAKEESVIKFLDELAFVKENFSYAEFTELVMEKIRYWERFMGRELMWVHWSDRSCFDQREAISNRVPYEEIYAASGGKILLQAHEKSQARGTKAPGIRLWRKLLFQERMYFSAAMTPKLIEMNKVLRRDMRRGMPPDSVDKNQDERHIFDSARYLVMSENWEELQDGILTMETAKREEPRLISVRL